MHQSQACKSRFVHGAPHVVLETTIRDRWFFEYKVGTIVRLNEDGKISSDEETFMMLIYC